MTLVAAPDVEEAFATWTLICERGMVVVVTGALVVVVTGTELEPLEISVLVPLASSRAATTTKAATTSTARTTLRCSTPRPDEDPGSFGGVLTLTSLPTRADHRKRELYPCPQHITAGVAQLEAQAICNRQVVGSSPTTGSMAQHPDPDTDDLSRVARRTRSVLTEFRGFILRGNVVDLAVAIAVGAAFTAVVTSLSAAFITPLIAAVFGKKSFETMHFTVNGSRFAYGLFINAVISFLITATVLFFFVVKPIQHLMVRLGMTSATPPDKAPCPACLTEIPVAATRCAACTTELDQGWAPPPAEA